MEDIWRDQHDTQTVFDMKGPLSSIGSSGALQLTKEQLDLGGAKKLVDNKYLRKKQQDVKYNIKSAQKASVGGFMKTDKASNIMGGLATATSGINSAVQNYTGTQQALNSGIHSAMQAMGP